MLRRLPRQTALTLIGLATLLGPTPAIPTPTQGDPYDIELQWANVDTPLNWTTDTNDLLARNALFRVVGDTDHAGVYAVLLTRAWIGASYFDPGKPGFNNPDLAGLAPFQTQQTFGSGTHPAIYSWQEIQPVLWSIWAPPNPDPNAANLRALPILQPNVGTTAARHWTSEYPHWETMTQVHWADRCAWQADELPRNQWPAGGERMFNLRQMWELAFEAQTPNFPMSGGRFLDHELFGDPAREAGIHLEVQALLFQGDVPPSQFPYDADDSALPPGLNTNPASGVGGFGGWVPQIETTPRLSYTLLHADGEKGHRLPPEDQWPNASVTMSTTPASAGDTLTILMDGLTRNTLLVAQINNNPNNRLNVPANAGDGPCEVEFQIPAGLPLGTTFQIVGTQDRDFLVPYERYQIQ